MPHDTQEVKDPTVELDAIANVPVLLVASDFDGTLAPIVSDPNHAFPQRETMVALKALAAMPNTHVALISGRALRDLATLTGSPDAIHLVGSHGSEFDPGFAAFLPPQTLQRLEQVVMKLEEIADQACGVIIERKPASVAFHYRNVVDVEEAQALVQAVLGGPATQPGIYQRNGKKVIELSVVATDKGEALKKIRSRVGASVAIYLGDDETDEDAFGTLSGPDLAVKVGDGPSCAPYRLQDTFEVARFLAALAERRAAWLTGSLAVPIEQHSFLSDQRTAALLTRDGRVTWLCVPRIDSPAIFAELIGGPTAGYFHICAADGSSPVEQSYCEDTLVLHTRWPTFEVVDYLDASGGRPEQRAGRSELMRVIQGKGTVRIEFAPRLDFGRTSTRLSVLEGGLEVEDSPDPIVLRAPGVQWALQDEGPHQFARATVELGPEPLVLELRCGTRSVDASVIEEPQRREQNRCYWSDWVRGLQIPHIGEPLIRRSALVLKGLCHGPSGAIAAAAT
ncbi:MAG: trehalose-phosphatase, partial [Planctomycetota bacterium]